MILKNLNDLENNYFDEALPIAGIELGGTKCICTLAYGPGRIISQRSIPTTNSDQTLTAIEAVLSNWWSDVGFRAMGIASMGPIRIAPEAIDFGHILATTKPGWPGADIARRLNRPFNVPLAFDTDVNGAAVAEILWGAGQGMTDFAYVTVGTGVGVGLIVNGQPTRGIGHSEIGHIRVPRLPGDTFKSACKFHVDCVEGLASGNAIKQRLGAEHVSNIDCEHFVWDVVADAITAMCHGLVCTAGPQRIVLGGGVITKQPHLLHRIGPMLERSLAGYIELPNDRDYVSAPGLNELAGPLGPIALAILNESVIKVPSQSV
jgi:fructokinase